MKHITKAFFSLTLLLGACDDGGTDEPGEQALVTAEDGRQGGWMAKLDRDQDGAISLEEAKGHRIEAKFAELDSDGDGRLTRDELAAMKAKHRKSPEERAAWMLAKFDANSDGALSREELGEHPLAARFAEADSDGDGKLSRDELMAFKSKRGKHGKRGKRGKHGGKMHSKDPVERAAMMLARFDANSDGVLTADEVAGHRYLAEQFATIDSDGDGKLSRDELAAFKAARHGKGRRGPPQE